MHQFDDLGAGKLVANFEIKVCTTRPPLGNGPTLCASAHRTTPPSLAPSNVYNQLSLRQTSSRSRTSLRGNSFQHTTDAMTTLEFPVTNFQPQSPLFGVLPGEIRNEIFALALMPHEDKEETYPENSYWFRPGFEAPRRSNSVLLRTCKAAYAEGQKVFLKELEWAFWFGKSTAIFVTTCRTNTKKKIAAQTDALETLHAFNSSKALLPRLLRRCKKSASSRKCTGLKAAAG